MLFSDRLRNYLIRKLFSTVDISSVARSDKGKMYIGGNEASPEEVDAMKEEIRFLESTRIWRLFQETVRYQAQETIITKSLSFDDVKSGKLMLVNLDILQSIVNIVKSYK